ncbi:MAG: ornithine cyclodeaminase family protein [Peptostreptococcaceae bacterium]|nr:ornithine cyclodeaminase family protein [Peptostreptococcaceae bacterium]
MKTLLLSYEDVLKVLSMKDVIEAVEGGYVSYNRGKVSQPDVVTVEEKNNNGETDIKSCYNEENDMVSIKIASGYWDNPKKYDISTMQGTIVILDGQNGLPVCVMDGSLITNYRTGAAGAISCKYLARKNSETVAVIGAGSQARMQIYALAELMPIKTVKVFSPKVEELEDYKADVEEKTGLEVIMCASVASAMKNADIAISTTPTKIYWVDKERVKDGLHIVAVGADMQGKNEWDPEIFIGSKIVVDSAKQCLSRGEIRNAVINGLILEDDIHAEIGEIIEGQKAGRISDNEITIFDTTGMGIQDNVTAVKIFELAKEKNIGTYFDFESK